MKLTRRYNWVSYVKALLSGNKAVLDQTLGIVTGLNYAFRCSIEQNRALQTECLELFKPPTSEGSVSEFAFALSYPLPLHISYVDVRELVPHR